MSNRKDWMPRTRQGVLDMAQTWIRVMADKLEAWGIPQAVRTDLIALHRAARDAYELVSSKDTRTPAAVAACREAFRVLKAKMCDVRTDCAEPRLNHMIHRLRRLHGLKRISVQKSVPPYGAICEICGPCDSDGKEERMT